VSCDLASDLALTDRELIAITGAGGKSTLLLHLARELAAGGKRVLVTTTTKMGPAQMAGLPAVCETVDHDRIERALDEHGLVGLVTGRDDRKVTGPPPQVLDELYRTAVVDYVLVEADGARGRSLKAPGEHEPVVPSTATLVVVLMGVDAVGGRVGEVAHRPQQAAALTGRTLDERLTIEDCVQVLTHSRGGLQGVPPAARVVVTLTKTETPEREAIAAGLTRSLLDHPRISRVIAR
jgi:molybdenum cofactor cytidylyltransferase